ncbi:MAG: transaldolase family protein, partial [Gammaproteobacteria bacterium]
MNSIQRAHQIGQAVWLDYIRRSLLNSGEFGEYVKKGISGVTSNPTIFEKAIIGSTDYDDALLQLAHTSLSTSEIYERLAIEDISSAAQQLRVTYEQTGGIHGYVSIEVSPL